MVILVKHVTIDARREAYVAKTEEEALELCKELMIKEIQKAITAKGQCSLAISGGKTPLPVFEQLTQPQESLLVNWPLVHIFWVDERCVPPEDPMSNYGNAIPYFSVPPLDRAKKHRLIGEKEPREHYAREYEKLLTKTCINGEIDLILLGIGEDGHTASLFPNTQALREKKHLYAPNFVPQKNEWRMTLTFPGLDLAHKTIVLCLGKGKAKILKQVFQKETSFEEIPAARIGTSKKPAVFILDKKSSYGLGL
jgi:6-phosphogluconolactonase